ncbi:hypothetical protein MLD38_006185 [Melastoma candidum]|uniref:Uncharacterized protein n=1 Tax=Melastoma candidum TaxID=119954 RepID=A0ACB9RM45_9MYRT|nr:hypothetical protein MLD38_006185 [Melastoma candidum]
MDGFTPTGLLGSVDVELLEEGGKRDRGAMKQLHDAAINGSVAELLDILRQYPDVLDRSPGSLSESPLHVSSLLGHYAFVGQLLTLKPELAKESDAHDGSLPLHLAAAKGYLGIVKNLLEAYPEASLVRNHDGRTPLHLAVIKGRVDVIAEMARTVPESTRVLTEGSDSALHLCVRYNKVEALNVLVEYIGRHDRFLGWRDRNGSTILHLAVTGKRLEIVRFLIRQTAIEVNTENGAGFTPLELLSRGPRDLRDMDIKRLLEEAEAIRDNWKDPLPMDEITEMPRQEEDDEHASDWIGSISRQPTLSKPKRKHTDWLGRRRSALMVVASLIATVAFQGTLNPPGGFWQDDFTADPAKNGTERSHHAGTAVMATTLAKAYGQFMIFNTLAFLSSLSIILLLISGLPMKTRRWMWTQMVITWVALTALTVTYFLAWIDLTPKDKSGVPNIVIGVSVALWFCLMGIVFLGNTARMARYLEWDDGNNGKAPEVKYLRMEKRVGKFMRKFVLPENADVLTVTVPKLPPPEPKKPRTIEVKIA